MSDITDPIDGLIRYVNEIKPFHSKIIEVLTEYVYSEDINVTTSEDLLLDVGIVVGTVDVEDNESETYGGAYDGGPYDSAQYFPVIGINPTLDGAFDASAGSAKLGYNYATSTVVLPGDQTAIYRQDRYIVVQLWKHAPATGTETLLITAQPQIISSTYVTNGQTGGISDYPRTVLVLSEIPNNTTSGMLIGNESFAARVTLLPVNILSVVTGSGNTGRVRYSTIPISGSATVPPYGIAGQPQIPRITDPYPYDPPYPPTPDIATLDNYITLSGDATKSYPYGASLLMLLQSGATVNYTVSASYYSSGTMTTTVELLQELDPTADYTNAKAIESFSGFSNKYILPSGSVTTVPEGLTQTNIAESVIFSWNNGSTEIENFVQLQIIETVIITINPGPGETYEYRIIMAYDGRVLTDYVNNGDTIRLVGPDYGTNDLFMVDDVTGNIITVVEPLNNSSNIGFVEPI